VLSILATIAKQERIRISERVHAGLAKARKQGRIGGRPRLVLDYKKALGLRQEGCTIREIADEMGTAPANIHRLLKSHRCAPVEIVPL
jgi:DNA invertase Pin-like site-specific DNA recombinase